MPFSRHELEKLYGSPFIDGNQIELLWKHKETFDLIFETLRQAKESICLEFYIFRNDETGIELSEILKEKSKEGIKVYILYDHFGSFGTPSSFWKGLREAGIETRAAHPIRFSLKDIKNYFHRDHKKLIIVDGRMAFLGGLNIANEYRGIHLRRAEPWRDTGVLITGTAAFSLLKAFKRAWLLWGGREFNIPLNEPQASGTLPVMPIFAHSSKGRRRLRRVIYYSINHAKEDISLTTAYFTPSKRMLEAIEGATRRGARVRILMPGISDVPAAYHAAKAFFGRLLMAGVEIYLYQGQILHAKSYVFDRLWSIVGSANLDFQSLRWNDEGNVGILDMGFAERMLNIFEQDLRRSIRVDYESWKRRPLKEKLIERFFSLFRRRL